MLRHVHPELWRNDFDGDVYLGDRPVDDALIIDIAVELSRFAGVSFRRTLVQEAITYVAGRHHRHPLADWLRSLTWDGVERLDRLLPDYLGTRDDALHRQLGLMWAVGAVSRPLDPGGKLDNTLVLIGDQGTGKSTAVATLAMRPEWFNDTPADLRSKDARLALRGTWLMELAGLDSLKRSELSAMKAFLTDAVDRFRPPYGRHDVRYKRSTVFVGTSNEQDILRDPTGDRRFWPVETTIIDLAALKRDREPLWAEAVERYQDGCQFWPTPAFETTLTRHRQQFQVGDAWLAPLATLLDDAPDEFTTYDAIVYGVGLSVAHTNSRSAEMRVSALLRKLGCRRGPRRGSGTKRIRTWTKPSV